MSDPEDPTHRVHLTPEEVAGLLRQNGRLKARVEYLEEVVDSSDSARLWDAVQRVYANPLAFVDGMEAEALALEANPL